MQKVLLVIDMQNDFIDGALGTKEAVAIVPNVIDKIKNFDGHVLYTRDTHIKDYMETQEGRLLPVPHCIEGSHGWELHPEIDKLRLAGEDPDSDFYNTFDKPSFGSTILGQALCMMDEAEAIESIEIIGLCTDVCVISNAMIVKAFLPETPVTVDSSCCAGVTPESHQTALDAMAACQIRII